MIIRPTLAFKGDRDYLHGTDMYRVLVESFIPGPILVKFLAFARRQVNIVEDGEYCYEPDMRAKWEIGGTRGFLVESDRPVEMRKPYDEAACLAGLGEPIEIATSRGKAACIDAVGPGKWALVKIKVSRPLRGQPMAKVTMHSANMAVVDVGDGQLTYVRHDGKS